MPGIAVMVSFGHLSVQPRTHPTNLDYGLHISLRHLRAGLLTMPGKTDVPMVSLITLTRANPRRD